MYHFNLSVEVWYSAVPLNLWTVSMYYIIILKITLGIKLSTACARTCNSIYVDLFLLRVFLVDFIKKFIPAIQNMSLMG